MCMRGRRDKKYILHIPYNRLTKNGTLRTIGKICDRPNIVAENVQTAGDLSCAGLEGRAVARCGMNEVNGAMEREPYGAEAAKWT